MHLNRLPLRYLITASLLGGAALLWLLSTAQVAAPLPARPPVSAGADAMQPVLPLEPIPDLPPDWVALGRRLFHAARLSADFSLARASCHNLGRLGQDPEISAAFARAYPDGLTAANVANAIATFERSMVTLNAPFDRYLRGDRAALSALELGGYRRFREFGCSSCQQGQLLGGNLFQKFGLLADYFTMRPVNEADLGRHNARHREADRHVFKVPGLRTIALTAPYFHDGSAATLEQAVSVMGRYQLGRELSEPGVRAIVAFLKRLTGELPRSAQP